MAHVLIVDDDADIRMMMLTQLPQLIRRPNANCGSVVGSSRHQHATSLNGSGSVARRSWHSSTTSPSPFDNNQAERDLRLLKVQQNVSGCFRSSGCAAAFARLRSYLSTLRQQGRALLAALETVFLGQPLYPELA